MKWILLKVAAWVVAYLVVGLLLFAACARWTSLPEDEAPNALRDITLGWLVIVLALPFILLHERFDVSWEHLARWLYRAIRPSKESQTTEAHP